MKNMLNITFIFVLLLFMACDKYEYFDGDDYYFDDYESYQDFDEFENGNDLFYFQITYGNSWIKLDTSNCLSGSQSLHFFGNKTENNLLSKCSYAFHKFAFWEGQTVSASANYLIPSDADLPWLFLLDLEERAVIGAGPGIRVFIADDNALGLNFKYLQPNIFQSDSEAVYVPRNVWFNLRMEVFLSQKNDGWVKVYQNDTLVIDAPNVQTLPTDILYSQQGTKGMYNSVEFGLTANPTNESLHLFLDDVEVSLVE